MTLHQLNCGTYWFIYMSLNHLVFGRVIYYAKNGTWTSFLQIRTAKQTGRAYCAYNSYDYYYLSNYQLSVSVSTALSLGMLFDKQCKETKNGWIKSISFDFKSFPLFFHLTDVKIRRIDWASSVPELFSCRDLAITRYTKPVLICIFSVAKSVVV